MQVLQNFEATSYCFYCEAKLISCISTMHCLLDSLWIKLLNTMQVASKKKSIADEAGMILQAKVKQLAPAT